MHESSSDEEDESVVSPPPPESPYLVAASISPVKSATPVDNDTSNKYPHLFQALGGEDVYLDQADTSVIKPMQGLLQEINNLLRTKYELNLQAISSNRPISYVQVPRTKSGNAFTNWKEWLDTAIKISGSQHGGTFESAYPITNHLIKFYKDLFLAACQTQGVLVIKPMGDTTF